MILDENKINLLSEHFDINTEYFENIKYILNFPNPHSELYTEKHHVLPKSLYPSHTHDKSNLINLSSYNHVMIHYYLAKCAKTKDAKTKMYTVLRFFSKNETRSSFKNISEDDYKN